MRSHLVEFVGPGSCALAGLLRDAAVWLDLNIAPTVLALTHSYDEEADQTTLLLTVQAFDSSDLDHMADADLGVLR